jgi:hypothetical protein
MVVGQMCFGYNTVTMLLRPFYWPADNHGCRCSHRRGSHCEDPKVREQVVEFIVDYKFLLLIFKLLNSLEYLPRSDRGQVLLNDAFWVAD